MLAFAGAGPFSLAAHPGYTPRHVETNTTFAVVAAVRPADTLMHCLGSGNFLGDHVE